MIYINISPIAFTIGPLTVRWYGIMVALAILSIVLWMLWQQKKGARLTQDNIFNAALVGIPSGVVFSRIFHLLDNIIVARIHPELVRTGEVIDYLQHPELIISAEGLTIWGAVLGAALGIWIFSRFAKFNFGYFADLITPGIIIAQAIGRVGCTLNGCCYGAETSCPWGIVYTNPESYAPIGVAVHPTQIYEIIFLLVLLGVLLKLRDRFQPEGSLFLIYLGMYSLWRLGIGFLREGTPFLSNFQEAQVISLVVLAIVVPLLTYRTRWVRKEAVTP